MGFVHLVWFFWISFVSRWGCGDAGLRSLRQEETPDPRPELWVCPSPFRAGGLGPGGPAPPGRGCPSLPTERGRAGRWEQKIANREIRDGSRAVVLGRTFVTVNAVMNR